MKPNKRAVRCADEELAENDPQILDRWLDLDREQTRIMRPHPHRQGQPEERPNQHRQSMDQKPVGARSTSDRKGTETSRRTDRMPVGREPKSDSPQNAQQDDTFLPGTVTQITPDDILAEEGPIEPRVSDGAVTAEEVEQDVATLNPSIDSMESRG